MGSFETTVIFKGVISVRGELGGHGTTVFVLHRYTTIQRFQDTPYSEISNLLILYDESLKLDATHQASSANECRVVLTHIT
jgi:hypothetical protein